MKTLLTSFAILLSVININGQSILKLKDTDHLGDLTGYYDDMVLKNEKYGNKKGLTYQWLKQYTIVYQDSINSDTGISVFNTKTGEFIFNSINTGIKKDGKKLKKLKYIGSFIVEEKIINLIFKDKDEFLIYALGSFFSLPLKNVENIENPIPITVFEGEPIWASKKSKKIFYKGIPLSLIKADFNLTIFRIDINELRFSQSSPILNDRNTNKETKDKLKKSLISVSKLSEKYGTKLERKSSKTAYKHLKTRNSYYR